MLHIDSYEKVVQFQGRLLSIKQAIGIYFAFLAAHVNWLPCLDFALYFSLKKICFKKLKTVLVLIGTNQTLKKLMLHIDSYEKVVQFQSWVAEFVD